MVINFEMGAFGSIEADMLASLNKIKIGEPRAAAIPRKREKMIEVYA